MSIIGGIPLLTLLRRRQPMIDRALRIAFVVVLVVFTIVRPVPAGDAHAYWVVDLANPYTRPVATQDAFTYTPPAAIFFAVLGRLPFEVFQAGWTLLVGVGLLWYVVRGEWRRLGVALGATGVLSAAALVIAPDLWRQWLEYVLATGVSPDVGSAYYLSIPLLVRLPAAALLIAWGARTNRPWTLPTGAMLGLPVLWLVGLAMLAGTFAVTAWGPLHATARRWTEHEGVQVSGRK